MTQIKPILFSTEMVKAILDGRKTMTRRVIKSKHESGLFRVGKRVSDGLVTEITSLDWDERPKDDCTNDIQPKYKAGDILWVRETWARHLDTDLFLYRSDCGNLNVGWNWKPSIFMPRQACRIFLEVTDVRAEKLGQLNEQDAIAEGIESFRPVPGDGPAVTLYRDYTGGPWTPNPLDSFKSLWISINGDWNPDQWVWVYPFKRIEKPEIF